MVEPTERYAVVTGSNKGIGFEIVRQLASAGIKVVLTARDEKRGLHALETLKASGLSDFVVFHQLDVADAASVASLAHFVKSQFGKLDILVNNAGIGGFEIRDSDLFNQVIITNGALSDDELKRTMTETYELAKECIQINYHGAKTTFEYLLPLLQLSDSPRVVNVSSVEGKTENVSNEWAKGVLSDVDKLTEERIDEVLKEFIKDYEEGSLERNGWPRYLAAYIVAKASMNAYTRIIAKKYPTFRINCVCPGYVKTDITANTGFYTTEEGAAHPVRYAVVTGSNKGIGLEIVRQLASAGIKVVLTARDEKRGLQALETFKASGLSDFVVFHQLDVADASSVASLADFVKSQFGKLDILVNNAGIGGIEIKDSELYSQVLITNGALSDEELERSMTHTFELAKECIQINYYGAKTTFEYLLPLLQLSDSPRVVNVSSALGKIECVSNEWAKGVFSDVDNLTEERIDEVIKEFIKDYEEGSLETKGWPRFLAAYTVAKASMNAYTRIIAKKYPTFRINCVCPGYVITDITGNTGFYTTEEGASHPVRLALLPNDGPSGVYYIRNEVSSF